MDIGLGILTFGTLGFVIAFSYASTRAMERRRNGSYEKSTLAIDAPNTRSNLTPAE